MIRKIRTAIATLAAFAGQIYTADGAALFAEIDRLRGAERDTKDLEDEALDEGGIISRT